MRIFFPVVCLALLASAAFAQTRLLHHPTWSNGKIAFVYQNDLWLAGDDGRNARRLTATKAAESLPTFSPDGKWLAFTSTREGYQAVYVMPAGGGESRQLTWFGGDRVVGWTPDSTKVVFFSSRDIGFGGTQSLWQVPVTGGMEKRILADRGALGSYSPDMKRFAYNRHSVQAYRKHYRGSAAADLWLMDVDKKTYTRLEDPGYAGNFGWPMYARDGFIYYVGDRLPNEEKVKPGSPEVMKSVFNIWKISERGGKPVQVTRHTSGNLYFPSMSGDGRTIVYEENFGIWKLDVPTGKTSEILVHLDAPESEPAIQTTTVDSELESFDLSPSTKRAAIAAKGRIFTIATETGELRRVTDSAFHDRAPKWSPDARKIAFLSDRSGRDEIWLSDERGAAPRQLTNYPGEKGAGYTWTPDSNSLVFATENKAVRVYLAGGKQDVLVQAGIGVGSLQVSPDSQWLAYTVTTPESLDRAFIKPLAGGEEHPISKKGSTRSYGLQWTPNGKKLLMLASTAGAVDTSQSILYAITLQQEDRNPNYKGVDDELEAAKADAPERKPGAPIEVKIDWDRIDRRTRQVSRLSESISAVAVAPDSRNYAVIAGGQVYVLDEDGARQTRISPPGAAGLQFSKDGRTVFYRNGKAMMAAGTTPPPATAPGPGPAPRKIAFTARFIADMREQRRSVFREAWRMLADRYYDKNLNGVDWLSVRNQYEPLLAFVNDQEGVAEILRQMIGELNTSHTSAIAPPPAQSAAPVRPGAVHPGFDVEEDAGFYRVARILKAGPADRDYSKIHKGDYLVSVNGAEIRAGDNYWKAYRDLIGQRIELTLNSKPSKEGAWQTFVAPAVDPRTLYYDEWVAERRAIVDKLSNGEFAYIHLRVMSPDILPQFEEDLYESRFKKGLILDVRFNGGGNLEMELLKILGQRPFLKLVTGGTPSTVFPRPFRGFNGSMVTIQNENSGSNAEMFPEAFRRLGLGKVVGMPTPGQVLLGSEYELSDGTRLLLGHGSVQTLDGVNLENHGTAPDVLIDNLPADWQSGRDAQLEKAIETLKSKQ